MAETENKTKYALITSTMAGWMLQNGLYIFDQRILYREGNRDTAATAREESARACPHSRRGLTPLGRLQKYPKIHVSTGEESSGSSTNSTQDLRPRHRRERNPERSPSNSHGDWPFLRPPERVPEVPVVSRDRLPQLEKIQEVIPSRPDEAHFR